MSVELSRRMAAVMFAPSVMELDRFGDLDKARSEVSKLDSFDDLSPETQQIIEAGEHELNEYRRKDKGNAERTSPDSIRRAAMDRGRFGAGRTHKASSAEAILRHCLRQRGWTGQHARGNLTGRQRLRLLEEIRRYARAWLRHEAEAFIRQYGVERGLAGAMVRHVGRFFERAKQFVHEAILAGTLAFFGPSDPLTDDDMRTVDAEAQAQTRYFDRFEQEVQSNPPIELTEPTPVGQPIEAKTVKQFVARAEQYGDAPWGAAQEVNRRRMIRGGGYTMERRVHGRLVDDMCETCSTAVAMGWQPVGVLPRIGDSECLGNCHCYFQYADAQGNVATTVRKSKGKKAAKATQAAGEPPLVVPATVEVKPRPVKVQPIKPTPVAPEYVIGPWVDAQGNAITYHYEEAP